MKMTQAVVALAAVGFLAMASGVSQAGPGCSAGKAAQTGSSGCVGKGTSVQTGGCGSMKASGGSCSAKSSSACTMESKDCEKMLRSYYKTHGWAGIESDCCMGMGTRPTVSRVVAGSPAERAGFKSGDVLTSVNGIGFTPENREAILGLMENGMKVGDTVRYTANRGAEVVTLDTTLEKISEPVLSAMIAEHLSMAHTDQKGSKTDKAEMVR